jgi:hypothetical protein
LVLPGIEPGSPGSWNVKAISFYYKDIFGCYGTYVTLDDDYEHESFVWRGICNGLFYPINCLEGKRMISKLSHNL